MKGLFAIIACFYGVGFAAIDHKYETSCLYFILAVLLGAWRYGGTADFVGHVDGVLELIDFKTGKGIWPEHFIQLAGYATPLVEMKIINKYPAQYRILNIPRAENEAFDEKVKTSLTVEWEIFKHWLAVYWLEKELEK